MLFTVDVDNPAHPGKRMVKVDRFLDPDWVKNHEERRNLTSLNLEDYPGPMTPFGQVPLLSPTDVPLKLTEKHYQAWLK